MIFICILNLMSLQINPIITQTEIFPNTCISNGKIILCYFHFVLVYSDFTRELFLWFVKY